MTTKTVYFCEVCKSVNNNEAFRTTPANFFAYSIHRSQLGSAPIPPFGANYHVCKDCDPTFNASLTTLLAPLDANKELLQQ